MNFIKSNAKKILTLIVLMLFVWYFICNIESFKPILDIKITFLVLVAIADVALKQAGSYSHSMKQLLVNPWFLSAIVLYIIQVIGFGYLFISAPYLNAQQTNPCGTPDILPDEMQAALTVVNQAQGQGTPAGAGPWNIPVWIYLVRDDAGYTSWQDVFAPQQLTSEANAYFTNGMNFYLCGVSYIDETDWYHFDDNSHLNKFGPNPVLAF